MESKKGLITKKLKTTKEKLTVEEEEMLEKINISESFIGEKTMKNLILPVYVIFWLPAMTYEGYGKLFKKKK